MGDFTGFTFNGVHSSDLGITRVSSGDRYEEKLHPEIKDITAEVPGRDGVYYFGTNYGVKTIDLEIAFDSLTEEQFRRLQQVFGVKGLQKLIFDERPYKYYMAKIESPVELSYVCFDEPDYEWKVDSNNRGVMGQPYEYKEYTGTTRRTYKGEGKITFVCNFPFAKSAYKTLPFSFQLTTDTEIQEDKKYYKCEDDNYVLVSEPDVSEINTYYEKVLSKESEEWAFSSGLLTDDEYTGIFDIYDDETEQIKIYNAGDIETGFRIYIPASIAITGFTLIYKEDGISDTAMLVINPVKLKKKDETTDIGLVVDTSNSTIMGVSQIIQDLPIITNDNLYNEFVESGYFFYFKPNNTKDGSILQIENGAEGIQIFYDYLYF